MFKENTQKVCLKGLPAVTWVSVAQHCQDEEAGPPSRAGSRDDCGQLWGGGKGGTKNALPAIPERAYDLRHRAPPSGGGGLRSSDCSEFLSLHLVPLACMLWNVYKSFTHVLPTLLALLSQ